MPLSINYTSGVGTFQGGTFQLVGVISSSYNTITVANLTFNSPGFQGTTIPANSQGVEITPPSTNLVGLTLKGVTGDTGIAIAPNQPTIIAFPTSEPGTNPIGITAAGVVTGTVTLTFF